MLVRHMALARVDGVGDAVERGVCVHDAGGEQAVGVGLLDGLGGVEVAQPGLGAHRR